MAKSVDVQAIERGLALLARQRLFSPNDLEIVVAAGAELERRGEPYNRLENRLLDVAERLGRWGRAAPRD